MAKQQSTMQMAQSSEGIMMVIIFFIIAVVNSVVIHFANSIFPDSVVLGTISIPRIWALILSSSVISLATVFALPFITATEKRMGRLWSPPEMMAMFFVVNFVAVWVFSRFAEIFGMGVSSWFVVLVLAAVLDFLQGMVMVLMGKVLQSR